MKMDTMIKLMKAKEQFSANHPKFAAFVRTMLQSQITEGTVIEITVTKPGQEPITTNMKIQQSDLELFEELKNLRN